jgi:hypothetical protein
VEHRCVAPASAFAEYGPETPRKGIGSNERTVASSGLLASGGSRSASADRIASSGF